ncbi:MAG TPA: hypothetical protein VFU19_03610 [Iamia sp.]|nr:hypothetical protein [Iamia sp.]
MTDERREGARDVAPEGPDPAVSDVASYLLSVGRRADKGIEERQQQIKGLQREQKHLRAVVALVSGVTEGLDAGHPGAALFTIDRAKDARAYLREHHPAVDERVEELRAALHPKVDEVISDLPRRLPAELDTRGVSLDASSRSPKFTVERSFLVATIDRKTRQATVQTRGGKKEKVAVDADLLADNIAAAWRRCFDRPTDLPALARRLHDAWKSLARPEATRVSMPSLVNELRKRDKDFSVDEFAVDLARLVTSGPGAVAEAEHLHLDHTKNDAEGLLLPGLEQSGYFGYITFDEGGAS